MPRKAQPKMVQRAAVHLPDPAVTKAEEIARRQAVVAYRRILKLAVRDADKVWDACWVLITFGTDERVKGQLLKEMLRTIAPEQKHHDGLRALAAGLQGGGGGGEMHLHIHAAGDVQLTRGTAASRDEAIELERVRRDELQGGGGGGARLQLPQLDRPLA